VKPHTLSKATSERNDPRLRLLIVLLEQGYPQAE